MSCFYSSYRDMLVLKCDGCGKSADLYKGETDRCMKHDWMRENGWKAYKSKDGKWKDICQDCKAAREEARRAKWVLKEGGETMHRT